MVLAECKLSIGQMIKDEMDDNKEYNRCREKVSVQYSTVQYSTVQYSTVHHSTVKYSALKYSTIQCSVAYSITL